SRVNLAERRGRYGSYTMEASVQFKGAKMGDLTATVVIEARSLLREALVSLMESHSYKVVCSIGSPADIHCNALKEEQPKLVMLGRLPAGDLADTTSRIRRCWHDAKIIPKY